MWCLLLCSLGLAVSSAAFAEAAPVDVKDSKKACAEDGMSAVGGDQGISLNVDLDDDHALRADDSALRDVLGSVIVDEDVAIVPCAFAESGRFGAICPDAGVVMVVDSGVVLCQVPRSLAVADHSPEKVSRHDSHLPSQSNFDGSNAAGDDDHNARNALDGVIVDVRRLTSWPAVAVFASRPLGKPPVPPA